VNKFEFDRKLLTAIKTNLSELKELLHKVESHSEDLWYRYYHQSFKVYMIQSETNAIVEMLKSLIPDHDLNEWFLNIIKDGTGKKFEYSHNKDWHNHTRPMLEAFSHAVYFLKQAIAHADEEIPDEGEMFCMSSGWAALLYFYNKR